MKVLELGSTTHYAELTWLDDGFVEDAPQKLWRRLPESLREIALEEIRHGNRTEGILENRERKIVLLSFREGPLVRREGDESLRVHTKHVYGIYCYDGTNATYEDVVSGCFLAFDDPEYEHPVF